MWRYHGIRGVDRFRHRVADCRSLGPVLRKTNPRKGCRGTALRHGLIYTCHVRGVVLQIPSTVSKGQRCVWQDQDSSGFILYNYDLAAQFAGDLPLDLFLDHFRSQYSYSLSKPWQGAASSIECRTAFNHHIGVGLQHRSGLLLGWPLKEPRTACKTRNDDWKNRSLAHR